MIQHIENFKAFIYDILPLKEEVFNLSLDFLEIHQVQKSNFLLESGDSCNQLFYVSEGIFRIYQLKDGVELNSCFCAENSIASSFESFTNDTPTVEYVQAIEDSKVVSLSKASLNILFKLDPSWQEVGRRITEKECIRLSRRVGSLSFETTKKKYEQLLLDQPNIVLRVPVQYIASYLGVSRETLSRIRSQLS